MIRIEVNGPEAEATIDGANNTLFPEFVVAVFTLMRTIGDGDRKRFGILKDFLMKELSGDNFFETLESGFIIEDSDVTEDDLPFT